MSEATENNSPNPAPASDATPAPAPVNADAPKPPEGLSENFWDNEKSEIKLNDLIADHGNLSKFKTETEARFKDRPESPDKYELRIPETVKLPEGVEFKFEQDSPLVKMARQIAFDSGRGQAGFDEMLGAFIENQVAQTAENETFAQEAFQAEMAKLGERGKERIEAVESYLKNSLGDDEYEALRSVAVSEAAIRGLEKLMSKSKDAAPVIPGDSGSEPKLTEQDLKAMQKDPKYWRDQDPAFIQKVTDGFKKLYPGQQQTSH